MSSSRLLSSLGLCYFLSPCLQRTYSWTKEVNAFCVLLKSSLLKHTHVILYDNATSFFHSCSSLLTLKPTLLLRLLTGQFSQSSRIGWAYCYHERDKII